jgi:L-iditol 2-dehydrogenase
MKGAVFHGPRIMRVEEVPLDHPGPGEALLRTRAVGICGSDIHGYTGRSGRRIPPLVMGHEVVGEIVEFGPAQRAPEQGIRPGVLVAVNPLWSCGKCSVCGAGAPHLCLNRKGLGMMTVPGAMADYFLAPVDNLVPLPKGISAAVGALAEPLAVGLHAWAMLAPSGRRPLVPPFRVAIIGAGMIGVTILAAMPAELHREVVVCDVRADRLDRIRTLVPGAAVENSSQIAWADVRRRHAPEGFDAVFEAVGLSTTAAASIELTRPGGIVVWVGNAEPDVTVSMQRVVTAEVTVTGSYAFTPEEFRQSVARLPRLSWLSGVVDAVLPLEAAPAAFADLAAAQAHMLKVILDPTLGSSDARRGSGAA